MGIKVDKTDGGMWAVDVDGSRYEFERWGAEDSLDTLTDLSSVVGAPLAAATAAAFGKDGKGMATNVTADMASEVVTSLTANMREHKAIVMGSIKKLAGRRVICDGRPVNFDDHYAYRLPHLFRVVRAALEVQYGSFFDAVRAVAPSAAPTTKPTALASTQAPTT